MNTLTKDQKRKMLIMVGFFIVMMALILTIMPAFADPTVPDGLKKMLTDLTFYVGLIFQGVGILLAIYAVGQMIMAFKDENPDAKTKAATLLIVAVILICIPAIIKGMDLVNKLTG